MAFKCSVIGVQIIRFTVQMFRITVQVLCNWCSYVIEIRKYNLIHDNIILNLFIYYFIGLVISRIGSVIIEPFLKKIKFVQFASYEDYVKQEKKDKRIVILNEHNNMFRTFLALMVVLGITKIYQYISIKFCFSQYNCIILIVVLLVLFLFSYRKQTSYIRRRVNTDEGV